MEKMQTINLTMIANTLKNLTVKDTEEENDFEEVPLPGNSSYIPVNEEKTIKKNSQLKPQEKTTKKTSQIKKQ